jgi:diguanylate cyclase (GGDEF)-like protein
MSPGDMRDPRLAELEFLSYLEQRTSVQVSKDGVSSDVGGDLGIGRRKWHDLIVHLMVEGFVRGPNIFGVLARASIPTENQGRARMHAIVDLEEGRSIQVDITHKGRLRLWELREDLESGRRLEPLGILFTREACELDYEVGWTFPGASSNLVLIALDLDNFKAVNDNYDHVIGDNVLRRFFSTVRDSVGRLGVAYRFGGDEVVVLCRGLDKERGLSVAESIRGNVEQEFMTRSGLERVSSPLTTSIGVLHLTVKKPFQSAYQEVDALERMAKKGGKNRVWDK